MLATGLCLLLWPLLGATAFPEELTFTYADPVGDATGTIDVISMVVAFDNMTGIYKITITTTNAQPFMGAFRININLFNPGRLPDNSFFQDAVNNYDLMTPATKIVLRGYDPDLLCWAMGDTVATNTIASGGQNPPGSSWYRCGVMNLPTTWPLKEDNIAYGISGIATISLLTPQGAISGLLDDVQVLMESGFLSTDQANGLFDKLSAALGSLNLGNTGPATNQISAFINQVSAFVRAGVLPSEEGQSLIMDAVTTQAKIGG